MRGHRLEVRRQVGGRVAERPRRGPEQQVLEDRVGPHVVAVAQGGVEHGGLVNVGHRDLVVVEATGRRALVHLHLHVAPRLMRHRGDDLKRGAHHVDGVQGGALEGLVGPAARQPVLLKGVLGALQFLLVVNAHTHAQAGRLVLGALDREAVMRPLLKAAQVERVLVLVAYQEPEHLGVELAALGEVARGEGRVAGAQEAEWRVQVRLRYGHWFSSSIRQIDVRMGKAGAREYRKTPASIARSHDRGGRRSNQQSPSGHDSVYVSDGR